MAAARELVIGDEPAAWRALGFAVGDDGTFALGPLVVRVAAGRDVELRIEGLVAERPDGLPLVAARDARRDGSAVSGADVHRDRSAASGADVHRDRSAASGAGGAGDPTASSHPNGATAVDHLVVFTDDRDRTTAALAAAGGDVRRRGGPPELPVPMAFVRFGELVVEVAQAGGPARVWGVTIVVPDLDALASPLLGVARPAVQPGRRIATITPAAGLSLAVALITPR
jgi:hypothetical protein